MTDPFVTVYDKLVSLLMAERTLFDPTCKNRDLIFPKNFIIYSGSQPYPEKKNRADGDFPELDLDEAGYVDPGFTSFRTFGNTSGAGCASIQELTQVFQITLTGRDNRIEPLSRLRFGVSLALSKGGPRLGLPNTLVKQWGPITGQPPSKVLVKGPALPNGGEDTGTWRRVLKVMIPVVIHVTNQDIQNT